MYSMPSHGKPCPSIVDLALLQCREGLNCRPRVRITKNEARCEQGRGAGNYS